MGHIGSGYCRTIGDKRSNVEIGHFSSNIDDTRFRVFIPATTHLIRDRVI